MSSDDDGDQCRVCYEGADEGILCQPCACRGTAAHIHINCLHQWRLAATARGHPSDRCPACKTEYDVRYLVPILAPTTTAPPMLRRQRDAIAMLYGDARPVRAQVAAAPSCLRCFLEWVATSPVASATIVTLLCYVPVRYTSMVDTVRLCDSLASTTHKCDNEALVVGVYQCGVFLAWQAPFDAYVAYTHGTSAWLCAFRGGVSGFLIGLCIMVCIVLSAHFHSILSSLFTAWVSVIATWAFIGFIERPATLPGWIVSA